MSVQVQQIEINLSPATPGDIVVNDIGEEKDKTMMDHTVEKLLDTAPPKAQIEHLYEKYLN